MKHFIQSTLLAAFLLSPTAAFAGASGNTCGCHSCQGKDGKCDKTSCDCQDDCECKKGGECKAGCTCGKDSKK